MDRNRQTTISIIAGLLLGATVGAFLGHVPSADGQFARNQVLKAEQINAALAAPTILGGSINNAPVGQATAAPGTFTVLRATSTSTFSPIDAMVLITPSGAGSVTLAPTLTAGRLDNLVIGGTTPLSGTFTIIRSNTAKLLRQGTGTGATQLASTQTTPPTCSTNCGTSPSVAGTDSDMIVTMGTGGSPASGFVITFGATWAASPVCVGAMAKTGMVVGKLPLTLVSTTTNLTVVTNGTAPATTDVYNLLCRGRQ